MKLAWTAWTALLFLLPGGAPFAHAHAGAATSPGPAAVVSEKDEHAGQAADYYARGRYVEAALEFEGLWRDYPAEPRFLFNAAASRYSAGHYAHTVAYLAEYLGRDEIGAEDRKEAQAQLDEARNKVTGLQVKVTMPAGASGEVRVVAKHVARGASDLRPELVVPTGRGGDMATAVVQLEPGSRWVLRAEADGLVGESQEVEVTREPNQQVALQLTAGAAVEGPVTGPKPEGVPPATRRALKIGFAAGGGALAAVGVAMLIGRRRRRA